MKEMCGLIKKDLLNLGSYKISIFMMLICVLIIGSIGENTCTYIPIIMASMVGMIGLSTFSYDEISKSENYILSLPISKKEVIIEKYIFSIIIVILGGLIGFLITPIFANILSNIRTDININVDYKSLLISTLGGILGISFIISIQIPSIYKWGAEKGRIQMFIIIFLIIIITAGILYVILKTGFNINLIDINNFLNKFGIPIFLISLIIMYYVSYKISYKIFLNSRK